MALKSRTVWMGVCMFLVAGITGVQDMIPEAVRTPLLGILTFAVAYFRVNPKQ